MHPFCTLLSFPASRCSSITLVLDYSTQEFRGGLLPACSRRLVPGKSPRGTDPVGILSADRGTLPSLPRSHLEPGVVPRRSLAAAPFDWVAGLPCGTPLAATPVVPVPGPQLLRGSAELRGPGTAHSLENGVGGRRGALGSQRSIVASAHAPGWLTPARRPSGPRLLTAWRGLRVRTTLVSRPPGGGRGGRPEGWVEGWGG